MPKRELLTIQIKMIYTLIALLISISMAYPMKFASAGDYDIPLSELNKVKKKKKHSSENREVLKKSKKRSKQKADEEVQEKEKVKSSDSTKPSKNQKEELAIAVEAPTILPVKTTNLTKAAESGSVLISHEPYSYLTTGHRTSIMAVLSSSEPLANVTCSFKTDVANGTITTQMSKVPGSLFTYSAILPALAEKATALHYRINAYTDKGVEVQSREYTIPVSSSTTIIPGWQLDHFKDSLELQVEPGNETLTGFKDPAIQQQTKKVKQK